MFFFRGFDQLRRNVPADAVGRVEFGDAFEAVFKQVVPAVVGRFAGFSPAADDHPVFGAGEGDIHQPPVFLGGFLLLLLFHPVAVFFVVGGRRGVEEQAVVVPENAGFPFTLRHPRGIGQNHHRRLQAF